MYVFPGAAKANKHRVGLQWEQCTFPWVGSAEAWNKVWGRAIYTKDSRKSSVIAPCSFKVLSTLLVSRITPISPFAQAFTLFCVSPLEVSCDVKTQMDNSRWFHLSFLDFIPTAKT